MNGLSHIEAIHEKNWTPRGGGRKSRVWRLHTLLFMLLDLLCVHVAFAGMVLLMKYLIGEDFGAVVTVKNYLRVWVGFSAFVVVLHSLSGEYRERRKNLEWTDALRLLVVVCVEFGIYYWSRKTWLQLPVRLYFVCLHGGLTYLELFLVRLFFQEFQRVRPQLTASRYLLAKRTLVVGAGRAGQNYAAILQSDPENRGYPVAFVDDDPLLRNRKFQGLRVVGNRDDIPEIAKTYGVERIVIAIPFPPQGALQEILNRCRQTSCEILKMNYGESLWNVDSYEEDMNISTVALPGFSPSQAEPREQATARLDQLLCREETGELVSRGPHPSQRLHLRPLSMQERLDRPELPNYNRRIASCIQGCRILVIGAGRLGSGLLEKILEYRPQEVLVLDSSAQLLIRCRDRLLRQFGEERLQACTFQQMDWKDPENQRWIVEQGAFDRTWIAWEYPAQHANLQVGTEETLLSAFVRCCQKLNGMGNCGSLVVLVPISVGAVEMDWKAAKQLLSSDRERLIRWVWLGRVLDPRDPSLLEWIADAVSFLHEGQPNPLPIATFPFAGGALSVDLMLGEAVFWSLLATDCAPSDLPYQVRWGDEIFQSEWLQLLANKYGFVCPEGTRSLEATAERIAIPARPTIYPGLFQVLDEEETA